MATKTLVTIKRNDPVRAAVASCETYHDSKGHAFRVVSEALAGHGYLLSKYCDTHLLDFHGRDGRMVLEICKDGRLCASDVVFSWYTMCTGRIELTCYIS